MKLKSYIFNCFLLLIPIFIWNLLLVDYLPYHYKPANFDQNVPDWILWSENILRVFVFGIPLILKLSMKTRSHKVGWGIYIVGVLLYFLSWIQVIENPTSYWSTHLIGFTAPAWTTLVWFIGISLIGRKSFLNIPKISVIYALLAISFVIIHTAHAYFAHAQISTRIS